jgi:hypothetical protein
MIRVISARSNTLSDCGVDMQAAVTCVAWKRWSGGTIPSGVIFSHFYVILCHTMSDVFSTHLFLTNFKLQPMSAVNNSAVSVGNDDLDVNELSEQLSIDMFASLSEFLKATLKSTRSKEYYNFFSSFSVFSLSIRSLIDCIHRADSVDDYHLLAELNTIAASRYASMTERTQAYMAFLAHIKTLRTSVHYYSQFILCSIFFVSFPPSRTRW